MALLYLNGTKKQSSLLISQQKKQLFFWWAGKVIRMIIFRNPELTAQHVYSPITHDPKTRTPVRVTLARAIEPPCLLSDVVAHRYDHHCQ